MKRISFLISTLLATSALIAQENGLESIGARVNVQTEIARQNKVIDGEWVAVGAKKEHVIMHDSNILFEGKPSYRFELKEDDNTLSDYKAGNTKGRAELSYCYATQKDFADLPKSTLENAEKMKMVYHYGKGIAPQGSTRSYTFSVYVPSDLSKEASTIFAQWHGMPDRRLVQTPEGVQKMLSDEEFLELYEKVVFKKNIAHEKITKTDKNGKTTETTGKPTGLLIEQGGYPPLAFGFSDGLFYIKANSDRKWMTDKDDRCNISPKKAEIMESQSSTYKTSTIAYKMPFNDFPKDAWVTFNIIIKWSKYSPSTQQIEQLGNLDVLMKYEAKGNAISNKIVDNKEIAIGRNDESGYYFKFGIYRVGNSTTPVRYNLAGYSEK